MSASRASLQAEHLALHRVPVLCVGQHCLQAPGPLWAASGLHSVEDRPCSPCSPLQSEAQVWEVTVAQPEAGEEVQMLSCTAFWQPLLGDLGFLQLQSLSLMLNSASIF